MESTGELEDIMKYQLNNMKNDLDKKLSK